MILAHRHNWAGSPNGYKCLDCDAQITHAEMAANPAPKGHNAPWEHVERKLNK